jgi:general secretion pathway protein G
MILLKGEKMNQKKTFRQLAQDGFTLIELLIVIAVIGLIGTLVATNVMKRFDEAKISAAYAQMRQLGVVLDDFRRVCGFYPSTEQGLDALVKAPQGRECKNYDPEGFIKGGHVPKDPWGFDYVYESDSNKYVIKSYGSDGQPGGTGSAKDLSSDDQQ